MIFIFQLVVILIASVCLGLSIRAIWKGAGYIAAANSTWSERTIDIVFRGKTFSRLIFRVTPIAILLTGAWAGYSVISGLLLPFDELGFVHRDDGEWMSYSQMGAATIGGPLGAAFADWLVRLCERKTLGEFVDEDLTPIEELTKILDT